MAGFSTANNEHLIRSDIWSTQIKEIFEDDLIAMKYVDMLEGFPDGDTFHIPSIGQAEILDYDEGQAVRYTAMDTGEFTFSITDYKQSATYVYKKFLQDSFYASRLVSQFVPKQARAIAKAMEVDILAVGPDGQTAADLNLINGAAHRFVGSGTSGIIALADFARAKYALQMANVPMTNLTAIVHPAVEYTLSTLTNLVNVSNNPRWEGVVRDGMSTGMRFIANVYGFDVYTSQNVKNVGAETINSVAATDGYANLFFSAAPDALPFVGAIRQAPQVDSEYNKDYQREEYVTTARWGFKLFRPENLVTVVTDLEI